MSLQDAIQEVMRGKSEIRKSLEKLNEEKDRNRKYLRDLFANEPRELKESLKKMRSAMNEKWRAEHSQEIEDLFQKEDFLREELRVN